MGGVATAEASLSYLERAVLKIVGDVYQRTREPVRTIAVQARLGKGDRNCRRYLAAMEARGYVLRVGERGGWLPVTQIEPARVAAEYVRMRQYASALEAQLKAAGVVVQPVKARPAPPPTDVGALAVQPPLPGFDDLVGDIYLN